MPTDETDHQELEGEPSAQDQTTDDTEDESREGESTDGQLGPAGEKALRTERQERRRLERELRQLQAQQPTEPSEPSDDALEQARREAADQARREATEAANGRLVRAEAKAKLAEHPLGVSTAAAMKMLDLDDVAVDDAGEIDAAALTDAITDLFDREPGLLKPDLPEPEKPAGKTPAASHGAGTTSREERVKDIRERMSKTSV